MGQIPSCEAEISSAGEEIACFFYGTYLFITVFTTARHLSLS
jgi:hypothetical protein